MNIADAIQEFCARVYEASSAMPSRIVLPPVAFDTLANDGHRSMRSYDDGTEDELGRLVPVLVIETGHGRVAIDRGRA